MCYRQNQFKVVCFLKRYGHSFYLCLVNILFFSPMPLMPIHISDSGFTKEISDLCVKVYAVKELSNLLADEVRIGLHHVGRARVKKEKQEITITPFVNGIYIYIHLEILTII